MKRKVVESKRGTPVWAGVSDEVRLRLYSLLECLRRRQPPLMEDIEWFAEYCEVSKPESEQP